MGERFYLAQLQATGTCPGINPSKKRKRKMPWDDEKKALAISMYEEAEPTPETSIEIVQSIADELGESANGVRMILTKAEVYIKKAPAAGKASGGGGGGGTRVSKEDAHADLKAAISDAGQDVDDDIIAKMTGKAAVYFAKVVRGTSE